MAINIKALRDQRAEKATAARNLLDTNTGDKWSKDIETQVDALYEEIDRIDAQISRAETQARIDGDQQLADSEREAGERTLRNLNPEARERQERYQAAFHTFVCHGVAGMDGDQIRILREGSVQAAQSGQPGNGSAGGYLVPTGFGGALLEALKQFGGMRTVANVIATESGIALPFPTVDETGQVGEIVAESVSASSQDVAFGVTSIGAYKFSSKVFTVPFELLMDQGPGIDIEAYIRRAAATRIARIQNQLFTTGTGTSQPKGVVTAAVSGKVGATGQTTTVIYDDLVDLIHSVDPAYRAMPGAKFMFHDTTLRNLKKLKDASGFPLWLPGVATKEPDTFLGEQYAINQDMPVMAASAKSIIYGDLKEYMIRDVMNVTLFRFDDSAYTKLGQVGFLAWARADGNLITGGAPVKFYQNSAS